MKTVVGVLISRNEKLSMIVFGRWHAGMKSVFVLITDGYLLPNELAHSLDHSRKESFNGSLIFGRLYLDQRDRIHACSEAWPMPIGGVPGIVNWVCCQLGQTG